MIQLPEEFGAIRLLTAALRRDVKMTKAKPPTGAEAPIAGMFVDGNNKPIGACLVDLSLAAYAGSALSLIPADAARDSIKARELDDFMQDNFAEVLNICSRLFDIDSEHRVRLSATSFPPNLYPADVATIVGGPAKRMDVDLEISGYGKGRFSLLLAA